MNFHPLRKKLFNIGVGSPLGWEHILLTGDYVWPEKDRLKEGGFRKLRNQNSI